MHAATKLRFARTPRTWTLSSPCDTSLPYRHLCSLGWPGAHQRGLNAATLNLTSDDELKYIVIGVIASPTAVSSAPLAPFITLGLVDRLHGIISALTLEELCVPPAALSTAQELLALAIGSVTGTPVAMGEGRRVWGDG